MNWTGGQVMWVGRTPTREGPGQLGPLTRTQARTDAGCDTTAGACAPCVPAAVASHTTTTCNGKGIYIKWHVTLRCNHRGMWPPAPYDCPSSLPASRLLGTLPPPPQKNHSHPAGGGLSTLPPSPPHLR